MSVNQIHASLTLVLIAWNVYSKVHQFYVFATLLHLVFLSLQDQIPPEACQSRNILEGVKKSALGSEASGCIYFHPATPLCNSIWTTLSLPEGCGSWDSIYGRTLYGCSFRGQDLQSLQNLCQGWKCPLLLEIHNSTRSELQKWNPLCGSLHLYLEVFVMQLSAAGCSVEQLVQVVGNGNQNVGGRTMATFSSLIICQSVQIEITSRRQLNWGDGEMNCTGQNAISQSSVSEAQFAAKRPVDFEKRKTEDLSEDGIGKNVLSILRRGSGVG